MRVLLDENVPAPLRRELTDHEVRTVPRMRWSGIKNGRLLRLAATEFDVLITIDRSIQHQQSLPGELALIVIRVPNNKPETVIPLAPDIRAALALVQPGETVTIDSLR